MNTLTLLGWLLVPVIVFFFWNNDNNEGELS